MAERIGLEAVFDLKNFNSGLSKYVDGVGKASQATDRAAGGMGKAWTNLGSIAGKAAVIMGGAIVTAGAAAGAAIAGFAISGIQKAADLEAQLSVIAATLNMTADEVQPLKDLILDLAINPNLKVSTTEAASAIENLAKNGLSMGQIMEGAAYSVVLLANATGADFGQAADIATDAMAIFKIDAKDMGEAVNGIVSVTNASKFSINDYSLALSQGGGVASAAGVSFDDFNSSIAAISPLFASGSDAGTSFKTMINSLTPNSAEAAATMKQLGLEFYDANGQMKSMSEVASELNEALFQEVAFSSTVNGATAEQTAQRKMLEKTISSTNAELYKYQVGINGVAQSEEDKIVSIDRLNREHDAAIAAYGQLATGLGTTVTVTRQLTEEERALAVETIFGADASRAAIALAESGNVIYTDLATAVKETGLSQQVLTQFMEDGSLTAFELIQAQQGLIDASTQAATRMDNLKGAMEIFWGVVEAVQIQIGDKFLPVLTKLARAFTGLVEQNAPAIIAAFGGIADNIASLIQYVGEFLATGEPFNQFFADLSPTVQSVVLGVGALVFVVQQASDLIASTIGTFVEWKDVLFVLGAAIAFTVIPAIWGMVAAMAPVILIFAGAVLAVAAVRTAWEADFLGIQTTTLAVFSAIQTAIAPLTEAITQFGAGALAEIKAFVAGNQTEFTNLAAIWEGAKTAASNLFASFNASMAGIIPGWQTIIDALSPIVIGYLAQLQLMLYTMAAIFMGAISLVAALISGDWAGAWTSAGNIAKAGADYISGTITNLSAILEVIWAKMIAPAWKWIADAMPLAISAIGAFATSLISAISARFPGWVASFSSWGAAAWQWIAKTIPTAVAQIGAWATRVISAVAEKLPSWIAGFLKWAKEMWIWIAAAAAPAAAAVAVWAGRLVGYLAANLPRWIAGFLKWAGGMVTWITSEAANALPHLGTWLGKLLGWMVLGGLAIGIQAAKWAFQLVDWVITDAAPKIGPNLLTFLGSLLGGMVTVAVGLYGFLRNMVTEMFTVISTGADWNALGQLILNNLRTGFESVRQAVYNGVTVFVGRVKAFFDLDSWKAIGSTILENARSGFNSIVSTFLSSVKVFIGKMVDKFVNTDWAQIGADIIDGILQGLEDNAQDVLDYLVGLAEDALGAVSDALGIESPSKEFIKIGEDMIEGWLVGLKQASPGLLSAIRDLTNQVLGGFSALSNVAGNFSGIGGNLSGQLKSQIDAIKASVGEDEEPSAGQQAEMDALQAQLDAFDAQKRATDMLKTQSDLIALIQKQGGNVGKIFAGITVGLAGSATDFIDIVSASMNFLNERTDAAMQIALKGYDRLIAEMQGKRQSIADIEADFTKRQLSRLEQHRDTIIKLDAEIAIAEDQLLETGDEAHLRRLEMLNDERKQATDSLRLFLTQIQNFQTAIDQMADRRPPVADVEAEFATHQLDQWEQYKDAIARLDVEIATSEKQLLETGDEEHLKRLEMLNGARQKSIQGLRTYFQQLRQIEAIGNVAQADDPILQSFIARRNQLLDLFKSATGDEQERVDILREYTQIVQRLAGFQAKIDQTGVLENQVDFLEKIRDLAEDTGDTDLLRRIFVGVNPNAPMTTEKWATLFERFTSESLQASQKQLATTLDEIETNIIVFGMRYDKQIDAMRHNRRSIESVEAQFQSTKFAALENFRKKITDLDSQIAAVEENVLTTGNLEQFRLLNSLNRYRQDAVKDLEIYLTQAKRLESTLGRIQTSTNERAQAAIDQFRKTAIDPLVEQFQSAIQGGPESRDVMLRMITDRTNAIDTYLASLDRITGIEGRVDLLGGSDELGSDFAQNAKAITDTLHDLNTTSFDRNVLLSNTERWLTNAEQALDLFNRVVGDDPLLQPLKESTKPLLQQLLAVNLSYSERIRLTNEYNKAVGRMLTIESKQNQLSSVESRLELLNRIRTLATDLNEPYTFDWIIRRIDFTKELSPDDLATVLSRYTDDATRLANERLTEALRPRVDVSSSIEWLRKGRTSIEEIQENLAGMPWSQFEHLKKSLASLDAQLAATEQQAIDQGSNDLLNRVRQLTTERQNVVNELRTHLQLIKSGEQILSTIPEVADARAQETVSKFKELYIDPLFARLDQTVSAASKNVFLNQMRTGVATINQFVAQVKRLEAAQKSLEPPPGAMETMLERFFNVSTSPTDRDSIIRFIGQVKTLQDSQKDIAAGLGINPLVGRFQTDVLDKILDKFYALNTTEAERLQLIQQYRMEQEKIVALQSKQQQLTFLKDQLSLLDELKSLNEEFGEQVALSDILAGIEFGINASMDDMLTFTSRAIDAMIRVTKEQLGISSPSKVFAQIGEYMMQGLGQGIQNASQYPTMAMASATQQVPYSVSNSRSVNVNQYIGNISSGMDERMFDARVRRIVEGMV